MRSSTTWKPGESGNRNGAPKKIRRLTAVLERALSRAVVLPDGIKLSGKEYVASLAVQGITTGKITLANGEEITLSPEDVLMLWKFAYQQVDGPPPAKTELTGEEGGPIKILVEYADDSPEIAETA